MGKGSGLCPVPSPPPGARCQPPLALQVPADQRDPRLPQLPPPLGEAGLRLSVPGVPPSASPRSVCTAIKPHRSQQPAAARGGTGTGLGAGGDREGAGEGPRGAGSAPRWRRGHHAALLGPRRPRPQIRHGRARCGPRRGEREALREAGRVAGTPRGPRGAAANFRLAVRGGSRGEAAVRNLRRSAGR